MKNPNQRINEALEASFFFHCLEQNVFSILGEWTTQDTFAKKLGLDLNCANVLLKTLARFSWVEEKDGLYRNKAEINACYNAASRHFLGNEMLQQLGRQSKVMEDLFTGQKPELKRGTLDFTSFFARQKAEAELFRGDFLKRKIAALTLPDRVEVLDLGGGCGALSRVLNSEVFQITLFEQKEVLEKSQADAFVDVRAGDFNRDPFGGPYDLVLASGILDFVDMKSKRFFSLLREAMKDKAYVFFWWLGMDPAWEGVRSLRWLSQQVQGRQLLAKKQVTKELAAHGFILLEEDFTGLYPLAIYQKSGS